MASIWASKSMSDCFSIALPLSCAFPFSAFFSASAARILRDFSRCTRQTNTRMTQGQPDMSSFAYEAPFTPTRPRKKRKSRPGKQPVDHSAVLERTRQELRAGDWARVSQGLSCAGPVVISSAFPDLPRIYIRPPSQRTARPGRISCSRSLPGARKSHLVARRACTARLAS